MNSLSNKDKSLTIGHKLAIAGGVAVLGFGLAACAGGSGDSASTPAPTETTVSDGTNEANIASGKLPAGWPSDVPTPPNTEVAGGAGGNGSFSASFKGSGSLSSELAAYKKELEANGWKLNQTINTGENLTGWDKGNRRVQVIAQDEGDGTYHINVTVVTKNS